MLLKKDSKIQSSKVKKCGLGRKIFESLTFFSFNGSNKDFNIIMWVWRVSFVPNMKNRPVLTGDETVWTISGIFDFGNGGGGGGFVFTDFGGGGGGFLVFKAPEFPSWNSKKYEKSFSY